MSDSKTEHRHPDLIKRELRDLEAATVGAREWLEGHPDDRVIALVVQQNAARKKHLVTELTDSHAAYRYHQVTYAIKTEERVEVGSLGTRLLAFCSVLQATMERIAKGQEFRLYFDTVVAGSFGALLSTDWDDHLLPGPLSGTLDFFFDTHDAMASGADGTADAVLAAFGDDKPLMRRYRRFFRSIAVGGLPVEIRWGRRNDAGDRSCLVDADGAKAIYRALVAADRPESQDVDVHGSIQGINLIENAMILVPFVRNGCKVKITFTDDYLPTLKRLLGDAAVVKYRVTSQYSDDEDRVTTTRTLLSLAPAAPVTGTPSASEPVTGGAELSPDDPAV